MKNLVVKFERYLDLQIQREKMLKDIEDELGFDISMSEEETIRNAKKSFFAALEVEVAKEIESWMK